MERPGRTSYEGMRFKTPEEEVSFLRDELARREAAAPEGEQIPREETAKQVLEEHRAQPQTVLHESHALPESEANAIVLNLEPEKHDEKIAELAGLLETRGIKNTLAVVEKLNDPHIEDDFHRFLVQYVAEGYPVKGLQEEGPLWRALQHTLYEVSLPSGGEEKELHAALSSMEQFFAGLFGVSKGGQRNSYALEIAKPVGSEEVSFFISVPKQFAASFEAQALSIFPGARVNVRTNDHNPFVEGGDIAGAVGELSTTPLFPLKTYDQFEYDPLNVILSAFAKRDQLKEGAAIQLVVHPAGDTYAKAFREARSKVMKGAKAESVPIRDSLGKKIAGELGAFIGSQKKKEEPAAPDQQALEQIDKKLGSSIVGVNMRLLASGSDPARAESVLSDLEGAFHQFLSPGGNALLFRRIPKKRIRSFVRNFSFRLFDRAEALPLSVAELAGMYHLSAAHVATSRELKKSAGTQAPAPTNMPEDGVLLGMNVFGGTETPAYIAPEDRLRHLYVIGQTGTGKTTLLKNLMIQDIQNGEGVCFIDPHGNDVADILAHIPPERHDDVIYFDPGYTDMPMGLNMLEYDPQKPEQKTFVVNEMLSIFKKLYGDVPESMGPAFEQYFRNATMLVIEDPATGSTLLDVARVLSDAQFRALKLSRCSNPLVVQFWRDIAEKAEGEYAALENIVPYITNKFDVFLANDIMRPIVAQERSSFDFRALMGEKKILLVNLSKGVLGDANANLIGLIVVGKLLMAALSRADAAGENLPPFYLYIDEFQNVTTDSISTIFSEARKYRFSLTVAHQFIAQLDARIRDSVFGNVGNKIAFRVGSDDAEYLEKQFAPTFAARDLQQLENRNAYVSQLVDGRPVTPFNIETVPLESGAPEQIDKLRSRSYERYGRPRADIEREINAKYKKS